MNLPANRTAPLPAPAGLATPSLLETQHTQLSRELENYLAPLVEYCGGLAENEHIDLIEFRRAQQLRQAMQALLRYDTGTEQLLDYYRRALTIAQHQAMQRVPSLEQALGISTPISTLPQC